MKAAKAKGVIITFILKRMLLVAALLLLLAPSAYAIEKEGRQAYYAEDGDTVEKVAFYYDLDSDLLVP